MHGVRNKQAHLYKTMHKALVSYHDLIKQVLFYYVGNIDFDISGISTKVSYENMWRSYFCSFLRCFDAKRRISDSLMAAAKIEKLLISIFFLMKKGIIEIEQKSSE